MGKGGIYIVKFVMNKAFILKRLELNFERNNFITESKFKSVMKLKGLS